MMNHGSFVISLDFEMMWGMHDVATKDGYGATNIQHVPDAIDRMLILFNKYGVHATFATVGMIMYENKEALLNDLPDIHPSYHNNACSPYGKVISGIKPEEERLFFQIAVVDKLKNTEGVEIATHTYCHYYCLELGQTIEQFEVDIKKAVEVARRNGIEIYSIVFPRNNVAKDYLKICAKYGIKSYRGNTSKYFDLTRNSLVFLKNRILRTLNSYINIAGNSSTPYKMIDMSEMPMNIRASRLLRPYSSKLSFLDWLRLHRIKNELIYAAKHNEMYHLWWHPHNFGSDTEENIAFLEKVLKCYKECHDKYGMMSYTMDEMRNVLTNNN